MDLSGCMVHVVIYVESGKRPFQAIFWNPVRARFNFEAYAWTTQWSSARFVFYCVKKKRYDCASQTVNMDARGYYMIYRKTGLRWSDCHGISRWEERAQASVVGIAEGVFIAASPCSSLFTDGNSAKAGNP